MFEWDRFMRDHVFPYADFKVSSACLLFAWKNYEALQDAAFGQHFLEHIHALFMFKLIQQEDIDICLKVVKDEVQRARLAGKVKSIEQKLGRTKIIEKREAIESALKNFHLR